MRRALKWSAVATLLLVVGGVATFTASYPAVAAVVCPGCYGLERAGDRLFVGRRMGEEDRTALLADLSWAKASVAAALEPTDARPFLFACSTDACDMRLGGHGATGARAQAFTTPLFSVVRFGPRGRGRTILAHELAHVTMHDIVGARMVLDGRFPAWLNEGVATIVSDDARYLHPGVTTGERCTADPLGALPASPFEWAMLSGHDSALYARAACAALHWLEANGGTEGLLTALRQAAATGEAVAR